MTTNEQVPAATGEYTHKQILTILTGLMLGMFLGSLDQTIVSTSIRTISDDLNGLSIQAWVTTAYLITTTLTTPIYGKLGDLYGRKRLFMFAITVFILGSAACSFATSMYELAIFRAFQGLGAGGLFTLVLAIIGDIVSPRERARYTGYFMAMFGVSSVLGPVIGGFFAGRNELFFMAGWRWVFLVNVPIGLLALVVVFRTLHVHHHKPSYRIIIDWWGALALVAGLVPLLTVAEQGREWGWDSTRSIACFVIAAVGLVAFVLIERGMGAAALIPMRLFSMKVVSLTVAGSVVIGAAMFGAMMIIPLYMQIVHGATPTESGFLMLPLVLGMMIASISSGRYISKTGTIRPFPIIGSAMVAVSLGLLSLTSADTSLVWVDLAMFTLGLGLGQCMQPLLMIIQNSVPPTDIGVATASATFFRQIGGTLGVAVFLSLLFSTLGDKVSAAVTKASTTPAFAEALKADPHYQAKLAQVQNDSSVIEQMNPVLSHPIKVGFAESMDLVFIGAATVAAIAFLVLMFLPPIRLRDMSASAARAAAEVTPSPIVEPEAGQPG